MNRNQRGCSIATRRHDSRGCHGKRTCGTLRRADIRGAVLLRPGCCDRDAAYRLLCRRDDTVPLRPPDPYFRLPGIAMTLRDQVREAAASLTAEAGIVIEHVAKGHIRKEAIVAKVLEQRGDHPGL